MNKRVREITAAALVFVGIGATASSATVTAAPRAKAPSCATVSAATVKSIVGGSPSGPSLQNSLCNYGTMSIFYGPETLLDVKSTLSVNKGAVVTGLGTYAFWFKPAKVPGATNLVVYASGYEMSISSSKVTLAKEELLAKKIVPLL